MNKLKFIVSISLLLIILGCRPTIALFDQYAYTQTTSIKVDALNVMSEATDSYRSHQQEVQQVATAIQKIIEYEKHRPNDTITTKMWEKIANAKGHLYSGFIERWKQKGKLDSAFVSDQQYVIGRAFDQIAELESKKIKPSQVSIQ